MQPIDIRSDDLEQSAKRCTVCAAVYRQALKRNAEAVGERKKVGGVGSLKVGGGITRFLKWIGDAK
jgi:hypothetical protein